MPDDVSGLCVIVSEYLPAFNADGSPGNSYDHVFQGPRLGPARDSARSSSFGYSRQSRIIPSDDLANAAMCVACEHHSA